MVNKKFKRITRYWIILGLVMIFFQVFLGGVTRITGSGLSITKWDIVVGSIPPLNDVEWHSAFDLYKETPQYEKINDGMSIGDFKFIFFWEFFHRLWARWIGLLFFAGFGYLLYKKALPRQMIKELIVVVVMGAIVASFGWIMVASGLMDRPWVNAYKLSLHLFLAFVTFAYLTWIYMKYFDENYKVIYNSKLKNIFLLFSILLITQLLLGGLMSGMKAGLSFPTWPDMNGKFIPEVLLISTNYNVDNLVKYDLFSFTPALVQLLHRSVAYLILIFMGYYFIQFKRIKSVASFWDLHLYLIIALVSQVVIGIFTVLYCKGTIPIGLGVLHQAVAIWVIFLSVRTYCFYK